MTRDEAIDKIRKLLNRNGRTEAEADTATILAACLAEKHGIDIAEIDRADQNREVQITHQVFGEWANVPDEAVYASLICKRFFEVSSFEQSNWMSGKLIFVGTEHHLTIAKYVFEFLVGEFRRAWNRRQSKRVKKRKAFLYGAYQALFSKLYLRFEQTKPAQLELALEVNFKAKREQYIKEHFGQMETASAGPKAKSAATIHGWHAGQSIDIRPGVQGNAEKPPNELTGGGAHLALGPGDPP